MTVLDEHIARVSVADKSVLLGRLCWYTVSEIKVDHRQVLTGLTAVGLAAHVPRYPRDHDVFRRVTTNAQRKKVQTATPGVYESYMIREVGNLGENLVTRRIVLEVHDQSGKTLDYKQLCDMTFNKLSGTITFTDRPESLDTGIAWGAPLYPVVKEITDEVQTQYDAWKGKLNAYTIREFIRKFVIDLGATLVREGGGVYFLREEQTATVDALETFVNALSDETHFHSLPLIDDVKQRAMVKKAFEAETVDLIDGMLIEIGDIQRAGKEITSKRYADMVTKYQTIIRNTADYRTLLETGLGETTSRLSLFQSAIVGLRERVKM